MPGFLPGVRAEAMMLQTLLPHSLVLAEPEVPGDQAAESELMPTKANVLSHLPTWPAIHLGCHWVVDYAIPSPSRLMLHDHKSGPFTIGTLSSLKLERALLAYLSASSTAVSSQTDVPDESISLASAFQLAGYPHVIGTLWDLDDVLAVMV